MEPLQLVLPERADERLERLLAAYESKLRKESQIMFRIGQRVQFSIRNTRNEGSTRVTLPGVVVSNPVEGTRPGTNIVQTRVSVITLREAADGRKYLRLSDEPEAFLALRGAPYIEGIDVDAEGTLLSVAELRQRQYADLQAFLGNHAEPPEVATETLTDAPLA